MMRCKICDVILSDYECTKKDSNGEYLDTCGQCLSSIREALQEFDEDIPYKYDIGLDNDEEI
jgi:hypothetical protein